MYVCMYVCMYTNNKKCVSRNVDDVWVGNIGSCGRALSQCRGCELGFECWSMALNNYNSGNNFCYCIVRRLGIILLLPVVFPLSLIYFLLCSPLPRGFLEGKGCYFFPLSKAYPRVPSFR